ncbi:MAG: DUF2726 domain-containing protein [Prosthecobacter sp.]
MKLIAPDPEVRIRMPYEYTAKALLTPTEARFHECLLQITDSRCRIQVKPRLADVFQHENVNGAFQKISQKHVDFLICRNDDWMPMLGIEVDDDSHQRADRKERDQFVNNLFASTGVPLLRLPVRELDHLEKLVSELTKAWHRRWKTLEMGT